VCACVSEGADIQYVFETAVTHHTVQYVSETAINHDTVQYVSETAITHHTIQYVSETAITHQTIQYVSEAAITYHTIEPETLKFSVCFRVKSKVVAAHVMNAYGWCRSRAPLILKFNTTLSNKRHAPAVLPPVKNHCTHLILTWMGPKISLDILEKRKGSYRCQDSIPGSSRQ
jgi:hypothetical protein